MAATNRQKQAIETKQKLLDSAERLIGERGYDAVSVDDIVADCGVAKGTFYHYFKTKDELAVYINHTPYERMKREAERTRDLPLRQRLAAFLDSCFSIAAQFNLHFSRQALRLYADPAFRGEFGGADSQVELGLEIVRSCLLDGVAAGEVREDAPVETLARTIVFAVQGTSLYQCKNYDTFDVKSWGEEFKKLALDVMIEPYLVKKK